MIGQSPNRTLDETSTARAVEAPMSLSLSSVVGTLQVVLATRRAARVAEHAARARAEGGL